MSTDHERLVATAHDLADASGTTIMPYFRAATSVENKAAGDQFDPVTEADRGAERTIREILAQKHPEHAVLGEEFPAEAGATTGSIYRWVIDPIDGTRAFIVGWPTWATLIGLEENGRPLLGVMNQPFTRERFWSDGAASYFRGPDGETTPIRTRTAQIATAQLSTTTPDMFTDDRDRCAFETVNARVRSCRYGGDSYAYCLLAMGLVDVVMEAHLKPYDIVALIPIIENAGGKVTDWTGATAANGGNVLACGDPSLHAELLDIIRDATA